MNTLYFDSPAAEWVQCLPLGNGRIGAMLDGGVPNGLVYLNDSTAWSGSPASEARDAPDAATAERALALARGAGDPVAAARHLEALQGRYSQAYLPVATLHLSAVAEGSGDYRRTLDLERGIHVVESGGSRQSSFVARDLDVLVVIVQGGEDATATLTTPLRLLERRAHADDDVLLLRLPSDVAPGHEPDLPGAEWDDTPGAALEGCAVVRRLVEPGRVVFLVTTATTYVAPDREPQGTAENTVALATARLDRAAEVGVDALLAEHTQAHAAVMGRVRLDLGETIDLPTDERVSAAAEAVEGAVPHDPALVALVFQYGRYLLWSSAKPGGLPPNLQGIWNAEMRPPWSSAYTININTQMNHWASYVTDLPETAEPFTDFILALADRATDVTERLYGLEGWTAGHNSDAWGYSSIVGRGHGDARWAFWPVAGAWLARHLTEAVDFGFGSDEDLERVWPALRGAAQFALGWHHPSATGWSTSPSTSPENAFLLEGTIAAVDDASAMDLALFRDLFERLRDAAARLSRGDDPIVLAAVARLEVLPVAPSIATDGTLLEWSEPRVEEDPHHRHTSHLYGLYPGSGAWDADHRAAAAATLERRGDESSGWALAWRIALWSRLGRGDKVEDLLRLLLRPVAEGRGQWAAGLYRSLLAAHPPFQIDGNLGATAGIAEALLQSHDGIELLPALPLSLATGRVEGLIARPGVRVAMSWRDGELVDAVLRPIADGTLTISYGGATLEIPGVAGVDIELTAASFAAAQPRMTHA